MGQNHLHGQWREFRIWNNTQKTKENYVKMILSSLAYVAPIRLSFCISTGEKEREREREREKEFLLRKKKKKFKIGLKRFYSQVNDKKKTR